MDKPPAETGDEILKQQKAEVEQKRLENNAKRTAKKAKEVFPHETWEDAASIILKTKGLNLPKNIGGIKVAKSRLTGNKNEESTVLKEIVQGKILADKGASVYLLPKLRNPDGSHAHGPDAIVNGSLVEFKAVTGGLRRIEVRFRKSREQSENVFIKIDNPDISKNDLIGKIRRILNDKEYTGGTKGNLVVYLSESKRTYFMRIRDLK
jgi:hypothetical protein